MFYHRSKEIAPERGVLDGAIRPLTCGRVNRTMKDSILTFLNIASKIPSQASALRGDLMDAAMWQDGHITQDSMYGLDDLASSIQFKHDEGMDMGYDAALRATKQCGLPKPGRDRPASFKSSQGATGPLPLPGGMI